MIRCLAADERGAREVAAAEAASIAAAGPGAVWIDFEDEPEDSVRGTLAPLGIHALVLQAVVARSKRPKVDDYGAYLHVVVHSARWDGERPYLRDVDMVVGARFLVTHHHGRTRSIDAGREVVPRRPELLAGGPARLMHFLLDVLVDHWMPIMDRIAKEVDALQESVLGSTDSAVHTRIVHLKRGMAALRRIVGPQRDTVLALTRDEFRPVPAEMRPYLRDVYDRLARVGDLLDSFRDETAALLDLHVSIVSNRLNEVIKRLTVVATVGLPLTLVTSYYGMNVGRPPMFPELGWLGGHPLLAVWIVLLATAGLTWWVLKRKHWM